MKPLACDNPATTVHSPKSGLRLGMSLSSRNTFQYSLETVSLLLRTSATVADLTCQLYLVAYALHLIFEEVLHIFFSFFFLLVQHHLFSLCHTYFTSLTCGYQQCILLFLLFKWLVGDNFTLDPQLLTYQTVVKNY